MALSDIKTSSPESFIETPLGKIANDWDRENRMHRSDDWFEGGRINQEAQEGFSSALRSGGDKIQAHGMSKEFTLGGGARNLLNLLKNGLDPARRGGRLDTAPLVNEPGEGLVGATANGSAYSDGPFILLQRPNTDGLTGKLENLGAILVNEAHPEITNALREAVEAIRPDITVGTYSSAGDVVASLKASSISGDGSAKFNGPKLENQHKADFDTRKSAAGDLPSPEQTESLHLEKDSHLESKINFLRGHGGSFSTTEATDRGETKTGYRLLKPSLSIENSGRKNQDEMAP